MKPIIFGFKARGLSSKKKKNFERKARGGALPSLLRGAPPVSFTETSWRLLNSRLRAFCSWLGRSNSLNYKAIFLDIRPFS